MQSRIAMLKALHQKLKQSSSADLNAALQQLEQLIHTDRPAYNQLMVLQGQYNNLETKFAQGLLTSENYKVQRTQLSNAVLHFIEELSLEDVTQTQLPQAMEHTSTRLTKDYQHFSWQVQTPLYLETFDNDDKGVFQNYDEPRWTARLENGLYRLENHADSHAVKYHYLNIDERNMEALPVAVETKVESNQQYPSPSAGILFCYDRQSSFYYAFIVDNERQYTLWRKGEQGYRTVISGRSSHINPNTFNRLGVIRANPYIYLFINDHFERKVEESTLLTGDTGIIAVGQGTFTFDNLTFFMPEG